MDTLARGSSGRTNPACAALEGAFLVGVLLTSTLIRVGMDKGGRRFEGSGCLIGWLEAERDVKGDRWTVVVEEDREG